MRNLITKRVEFSASHRYWNNSWSDHKNKEIFGKHTNSHGHNFVLEVSVEGPVDDRTGMIINLFDLKRILNRVLEDFDHKNLNDDTPYFNDRVPTPENISRILWELICTELNKFDPCCNIHSIRLFETPDLYVEYRREEP